MRLLAHFFIKKCNLLLFYPSICRCGKIVGDILEGEKLMITDFSSHAILSIVSHLSFIAVSWWALQALNFDKFLRANRVFQARVLYILLSIFLGSTVSNFFLDYLLWSQQLPTLFF